MHKKAQFRSKGKKSKVCFFSKKQFPKKKMQENFYTRLDCFVLRNVAMLGMISRRLSPIGAKLYLLPQFTKAKNNCQIFLSFFQKKSLFFFHRRFLCCFALSFLRTKSTAGRTSTP
jgi:hypothetical protein